MAVQHLTSEFLEHYSLEQLQSLLNSLTSLPTTQTDWSEALWYLDRVEALHIAIAEKIRMQGSCCFATQTTGSHPYRPHRLIVSLQKLIAIFDDYN